MSESLEEHAQQEDLRLALRRTQGQLAKAKAKVDDLVEATTRAAYDATLSFGPIPAVAPPPLITPNVNAPEAALWHMTDWQGGKRTTSYDSEVMRERVMRFVKKARNITNIQRADHPVDECVILFGGDMIEGLFNFPTQPFEIDSTIFTQYVNVSRLIVEIVREALAAYERVTVVAEWGNHGRIGSKRDAVPRSDNIDRMVYELARQLLAGEERLTWQDCPEDIQRVEIGNYKALSVHGDEVGRNGFVADTAFVNHVNKWRSGSYPWDFKDVYVGHYHQHKELPMSNGQGAIFWTGSTESDNRYASIGLASTAIPTQRLHFIDKVKGRVTAQYKIFVDTD